MPATETKIANPESPAVLLHHPTRTARKRWRGEYGAQRSIVCFCRDIEERIRTRPDMELGLERCYTRVAGHSQEVEEDLATVGDNSRFGDDHLQ